MAKVRSKLFYVRIPFLLLLSWVVYWGNAKCLAKPNRTILIFRFSGKEFDLVAQGIKDDLADEFNVVESISKNDISDEKLAGVMHAVDPDLVVLMDNKTIKAYAAFVQTLPFPEMAKPSVSLMSLYLDWTLKNIPKMPNATGIRYEIPLVTSGVKLRSLSKNKIERIGVLYREKVEDYVSENKKLSKAEDIDLIGVRLSNQSKTRTEDIRTGLKELCEKHKIDALWVLNDNSLLNQETLTEAWIPATKKYGLPIIVGVELLVRPSLGFGTLAVLPDHYSLGVQASGLIYDIFEAGDVASEPIQHPISIVTLRRGEVKVGQSR